MKYQVFATFNETIFLGEFGAGSEEEAIDAASRSSRINDADFNFRDYAQGDCELIEIMAQPNTKD